MQKFLLDEGVSRSTSAFLKDLDFDVKYVVDEGLQGQEDENVIAYANKENRIIITVDKDFGNLMNYPLAEHSGVVLFRLKDETPQNVNKRLQELFDTVGVQNLQNVLAVVTEKKIRIRSRELEK